MEKSGLQQVNANTAYLDLMKNTREQRRKMMASKKRDDGLICRLCGKTTRNGQDTCTKCHVATCDSCFCECEPKQIAWKRANFWERMYLDGPCDCTGQRT